MSGGPRCTRGDHRHVVVVRNGNYSAFNGYRRTWSEYSQVWCVDNAQRINQIDGEGSRPVVWRASGPGVDALPDATHDDLLKLGFPDPSRVTR